MPTIISTGKVTPALTAVRTSAEGPAIAVGTVVETSDGGEAIYVQATSTIAQYDACIIINTSSATGASIGCVPVTTTNALTSQRLAFAQTAIASGGYGWVQTKGNEIRVNSLIAAQPHVPLFTTATAGSLDDAVVTAGYCLGVVLKSSATSASAPPAVAGHTVIRTWAGG
jgi:hypothetical protein